MILTVVHVIASMFFSSANCDAVDPITGLSVCEMRDIETRAVAHRDSIKSVRLGVTETELEYAAVCSLECFPRRLACGKRSPKDKNYACMIEATSDDEVGTDAKEAK